MIAITQAKTGRSRKNFENIKFLHLNEASPELKSVASSYCRQAGIKKQITSFIPRPENPGFSAKD